MPISPGRRALQLVTPQDLFTSLNATLSDKSNNRPVTPSRSIRDTDYTVPAPPPPSPVSFRADHWPTVTRR